MLSLKDGRFYTGYTANLRNRFLQHPRGKVKSTANRGPLKLIPYEYCINEHDARPREVFLKSGFGRQELKKSLKHTLSQ